MTITQDFAEALQIDKVEMDSYNPILAKFAELKEVLQQNFKIKTTKRSWYGKIKQVLDDVIHIDIEDKVTHNDSKYLFIRIHGYNYIMGLGEYGDLKDKLYFISPTSSRSDSQNKTIVFTSRMFGTYDFCLEDKITNVQLFVDLIKKYKTYLVTQ